MVGQEQDMRTGLQMYLEGLAHDFVEDLPIEALLRCHNLKLNYLEARKFLIEFLARLDKK